MKTFLRIALATVLLAPSIGMQQAVAESTSLHSTRRAHPEFTRGRNDANGVLAELQQQYGTSQQFYDHVDALRESAYTLQQEAAADGIVDDYQYWSGQLNVWTLWSN